MAPKVLHIGFSKCASTYLRALFRAHPQIRLVFKSNFFTPFIHTGMTFDQYQALFSADSRITNVESDEHIVLPGVHPELGVRTTELTTFELVADDIKARLPHVKLILVIRNQSSLLVARYSEYLITGGALDFERFAAAMIGTRSDENVHYQNYYSEIIRILEDRFPKDNILVLLQEEMKRDSPGTLRQLTEFMSLDQPLAPVKGLRSERKSLSLNGMRFLRFLNKVLVHRSSMGGAAPHTNIPLFIYLNIVRFVRLVDFHLLSRFSPASYDILTDTLRADIVSKFRKDNLRLQDVLQIDLERFGYLS